MEKFEVEKMIKNLANLYPGTFKIREAKELAEVVDNWFFYLEDENSHKIAQNLKAHVKTRRFPPTIADLLKINQERAIPSYEETRLMLDEIKNIVPATKEERERATEGIKELLEGWKKHDE